MLEFWKSLWPAGVGVSDWYSQQVSFGLQFFVEWAKVLCRSPKARVLVNGSEFDIFPLRRCTCQGCLLSPLLFAPALKPLAGAISAHQGLSGVKLGDGENRLSLYADDVLLFVTNTENSISALISIIDQFGLILGYTINSNKSEDDVRDLASFTHFPFR